MLHFDGSEPLNVDELRERLRSMTDTELRRFGCAAAFMASPAASHGREPRSVFVLQLEEARAEWKRRHPHDKTHLT